MGDVVKRLSGPSAMAAGDNTLLSTPLGHTVIVERLHIVNSTSATKLSAKVGVGSSADASLVTPLISVPGRQMIDQTTYVVLHAPDGGVADSLVLNASDVGLTVTVYGVDQYPPY